MTERSTKLYAHWEDGRNGSFWWHFYPSTHVYTKGLIGFDADEVDPVLVRDLREGEDSPYWAWWDLQNKDHRTSESKPCFAHVYPNKGLVEMCFLYGTKAEEERGYGLLLNVFVEKREEEYDG